jgi:predicted RecA/RadA family phage recombinase
MASNHVQTGNTLTLTAPYTRTAGQGALIGTAIFGVAEQDVTSGAEGEFSLTEVWDLAKGVASADTFAVGDIVYWDNSAKHCSPTDGDGVEIGVCVKEATAADTTVRVRLNGIAAK